MLKEHPSNKHLKMNSSQLMATVQQSDQPAAGKQFPMMVIGVYYK